MEELIQKIRETNQLQIYTVNDVWTIQLFELNTCPNDIGVSCIWENSNSDLMCLLQWAYEYTQVNYDKY